MRSATELTYFLIGLQLKMKVFTAVIHKEGIEPLSILLSFVSPPFTYFLFQNFPPLIY